MDIIISANEKILSLTQDNRLLENMTEKEYADWLNKMIKVGTDNETEIQKVPI